MKDEESLKAGALVSKLADSVKDEVNNLLTCIEIKHKMTRLRDHFLLFPRSPSELILWADP